ncbi:MAG TPA: hypothetical protein PKJ72_14605 [Deltaproteobacteria bacterium]|nr:hypothetical protein [Deltaproteobacteria bacterium]
MNAVRPDLKFTIEGHRIAARCFNEDKAGTPIVFIHFLGILVLPKMVEPVIMVLGVIELAGALWTIVALKSDRAYSSGS